MWGVGAFACSFVSACLFLVQFLHRSLLVLLLGVNGKLAARLSRRGRPYGDPPLKRFFLFTSLLQFLQFRVPSFAALAI